MWQRMHGPLETLIRKQSSVCVCSWRLACASCGRITGTFEAGNSSLEDREFTRLYQIARRCQHNNNKRLRKTVQTPDSLSVRRATFAPMSIISVTLLGRGSSTQDDSNGEHH